MQHFGSRRDELKPSFVELSGGPEAHEGGCEGGPNGEIWIESGACFC
jgi:hypothetical protein